MNTRRSGIRPESRSQTTAPPPPDEAGTKRVADPTPHRDGLTTPHLPGGTAPRLPHERDESSDSQTAGNREVMRRAHDDLAQGRVDTDRGPVLDAVYENSVRPPHEATRDRSAPSAARRKSRGRR